MANLDLLNEFWKQTEQHANWRGYASTVRQMRPFSLDDDLASVIRQLAEGRSSRELHNYLISARLPFPTMWLEVDFDAAFGGRVAPWHDVDGAEFRLTKAKPIRVGWIVTEAPPGSGIIAMTRVARVASPITGEVGAMIYPNTLMFSSDRRMGIESETFRSMGGIIDPEVLHAIRTFNQMPLSGAGPWGFNDRILKPDTEAGEVDAINAAFEQSLLHETVLTVIEPRTIEGLINPVSPVSTSLYDRAFSIMQAGFSDQYSELGFVVAALALINEVPVKYVPFRPSGSLRAGGRLRPYMSSSIVMIEVPATRRRIKDIRDRLKTAAKEHAVRALHEVRGHWRHVYKLPRAAATNHRWSPWVDRFGRPCWRTFIEHHERGSGKIGFVRQTYTAVRGRGRIPGVEGDLNGAPIA